MSAWNPERFCKASAGSHGVDKKPKREALKLAGIAFIKAIGFVLVCWGAAVIGLGLVVLNILAVRYFSAGLFTFLTALAAEIAILAGIAAGVMEYRRNRP